MKKKTSEPISLTSWNCGWGNNTRHHHGRSVRRVFGREDCCCRAFACRKEVSWSTTESWEKSSKVHSSKIGSPSLKHLKKPFDETIAVVNRVLSACRVGCAGLWCRQDKFLSKLKVLEADIAKPLKLCPSGPLRVPPKWLNSLKQKVRKALNGFLWSLNTR